MGEEEKKPEEKKMEEKKPEEEKKEEEKQSEKPAEEKKAEEGKDGKEAKDQSETQAPQEIVLRVYMHCEGCARKVRRCLKGFEGVEKVIADCKTSKVVVKGGKADPLNVLQRVQRKSHRQVQLISPIPEPKAEEEKKPEDQKETPKPEEKKEEPQIITAVLKVHMHCEACAQEIKKRILRMKGVESVEPDLKSSEVIVKGVFDQAKLVEYVYKRTGKHAAIVKQEPEKKKEKAKDDDSKEEKKAEEDGGGGDDKGGSDDQEENKEKKGGDEESNSKPDSGGGAAMEEEINKVVELQKNAYYYYPQRYAMEMHAYPPQIFSDENPNACSIV
ncbi:hypothetical protein F2P56_019541 [Juglans regia]|uniref:HMA domain-containing protein n=2 Tax=Juglans regia TaxID=51240 RepID=A0A833UDV2_JUGRE|nr:heavy metal-associated isoprenylated plant protein 7-like [Juglans regia]KAF5459604.1 hypothetical protein F2P56_019541 [Juglans regia]